MVCLQVSILFSTKKELGILSMGEDMELKTTMLRWSWWDVQNETNSKETIPSCEGVVQNVTAMVHDAMSLKKEPKPAACFGQGCRFHQAPDDVLQVDIDGAFLKKERIGACAFDQAVVAEAGKLAAVHDALCVEMHT